MQRDYFPVQRVDRVSGEILEAYLSDAREALSSPLDEGRLFITDYGEPFIGSRLGSLVKRYLNKAGIEVVGSCHLLRHAAATHMLENGADIRFIQVLLGHEGLTSTQVYTQVSVEKLRLVVVATHPAKLVEAVPAQAGGQSCVVEHDLEAVA